MKYLVGAVATLFLTFCLMWCIGHIPFTDDMGGMLEELCGYLGIYGVENVEDFYMAVTFVISLIAALLIVWRIARVIIHRTQYPR
jgi:hypothetical protein